MGQDIASEVSVPAIFRPGFGIPARVANLVADWLMANAINLKLDLGCFRTYGKRDSSVRSDAGEAIEKREKRENREKHNKHNKYEAWPKPNMPQSQKA